MKNKQLEAKLKALKKRISHETSIPSSLDRDIEKWIKKTTDSQLKKIEMQEEKLFEEFIQNDKKSR